MYLLFETRCEVHRPQLFHTYKLFYRYTQTAIKNRGTEFLLSSVPTVEGVSSIVPIYHGIGGDPLEMGILWP